MINMEYKDLKEQFVSNLTGTNAEEVLCLSCVTLFGTSLLSLGLRIANKWCSTKRSQPWVLSKIECLLVYLPILLTSTIFSDYIKYIVIFLITMLILSVILIYCKSISKKIKHKSYREYGEDRTPTLQFLTNFRSHLLLDTVVSILAVDFKVYPRRFAKTELFGWGYMDAGVGSFVMAAGLIAKEARVYKPSTLKSSLKREIWNSLPILLIGIIRAFAVEMTNYQKHLSEYGSHWNFFLTLGFTTIIGTLIISSLPTSFSLISLALIMGYQLALNLGCTDFITSSNRENLLSANKEGLLSLCGYVGLYLLAILLGKFIHKRMTSEENNFKNQCLLLTLAVLSHLLMYGAHYYIQPVSRRLVNLGYIFWMISLSSYHLFLHSLCYSFIHNSNILFEAINYNALFYFLFANLLTGLINITIPTINLGTDLSLSILFLYLSVLAIANIQLYNRRMAIKTPFLRKKIKSV